MKVKFLQDCEIEITSNSLNSPRDYSKGEVTTRSFKEGEVAEFDICSYFMKADEFENELTEPNVQFKDLTVAFRLSVDLFEVIDESPVVYEDGTSIRSYSIEGERT
jgi:hypothetical protein